MLGIIHHMNVQIWHPTSFLSSSVWTRANAKLVDLSLRVSDKALATRIERKWTILAKIAGRSGKVTPREKQTFESDLDKLFNILICSCDFIDCSAAKCSDDNCPSVHIDCHCPRESKIPQLDLPFVKDQRGKTGTKGQMQMGLPDAQETARQLKAMKRKEVEERRTAEKEAKRKRAEEDLRQRIEDQLEEDMEGESSEELSEMRVDPTFSNERIERRIRLESHTQNRTPLPTVAESAIRYDVSLRATAVIVTSTLIDYKIITADNTSQIASHSKIEREIERCLAEMEKLRLEVEQSISCVFFDGRCDKTNVMLEDEAGKKYPSVQMEEHISLTSEPGGEYLGHLSPAAKDAKTTADELYAFFVKEGIDKTLEYTGGDSTNHVTGAQGGTMRHLEELLGHRLVRSICELHTNELPLRHIIAELDGPTSGANSFSGMRERA